MSLLVCLSLLVGQVPAPEPTAYAGLLARRVDARGLVDYRAIAEKELPVLDGYLAWVATAKAPAEPLGFYADAYNALVIRAVIREGFPRSVLDVKGFFDQKTYRVAGRTLTLDALEKEVIRPLGSPGHHFLLVCGAVGCPQLEPKALMGTDVHARAEAAARRYLAGPRGAKADGGNLRLSRIFEWYAPDFGGSAGVWRYVKPRLPEAVVKAVADPPKVEPIDYDWSLNQP